jgi:hypothetical protein
MLILSSGTLNFFLWGGANNLYFFGHLNILFLSSFSLSVGVLRFTMKSEFCKCKFSVIAKFRQKFAELATNSSFFLFFFRYFDLVLVLAVYSVMCNFLELYVVQFFCKSTNIGY